LRNPTWSEFDSMSKSLLGPEFHKFSKILKNPQSV
jgi:hypothetical protein